MELWIRSQDKKLLIKCEKIEAVSNWICVNGTINVGSFSLKDGDSRALEVLDEIQNKIKTIYYLKPKCILELKDIKLGKRYFEKLNNMNFVTTDNNFEIIPFSTNVVIYEIPEK